MLERERLLGGWTTIDGSVRAQVSCAQYLLCHQHYAAIDLLARNELFSSAYALFRPQFEALVTGLWFQCAATEDDVERFGRYGAASDLQTKVKKIEAAAGNPLPKGVLQGFRERNKSGLDDMTHGGARQTLSMLKEGFGANEERSAVWLVKQSTVLSHLSAVGVASLADNEPLMLSLHAAFENVREQLSTR
jgi:hypothetical protein